MLKNLLRNLPRLDEVLGVRFERPAETAARRRGDGSCRGRLLATADQRRRSRSVKEAS